MANNNVCYSPSKGLWFPKSRGVGDWRALRLVREGAVGHGRVAIIAGRIGLAACAVAQVMAMEYGVPGAALATSDGVMRGVPGVPYAALGRGYPVAVYFSRHPISDEQPTAVFPVRRRSPTLGVATFALAQLFAGPTSREARAGYYTPLPGALHGASTCGKRDFTIRLDRRGAIAERGTATVRICRPTRLAGILADARIKTEMTATLRQFPAIRAVVILDAQGHCFGDLSGRDVCLHPSS